MINETKIVMSGIFRTILNIYDEAFSKIVHSFWLIIFEKYFKRSYQQCNKGYLRSWQVGGVNDAAGHKD